MSEKYQTVILTLDDGSTIAYTGTAQVFEGTERRIRDIKFTEPQELPEGCTFGSLGDRESSVEVKS